ncbi:hypothetical protein Nepgr_021303 [Nepenthes gracilis]|uniref:Gnk2-homologous domain-containing protein n=1 Tax=Nepenthes gracilis TaxID=150966 RepID=A0AAD3SYK3_NEPGR|nr:hypothetical protein Nepgr_021303 [Nepenthes gracilis]
MLNDKNITGTSVGSFEQVVNDTFKEIAFEAAKGDRLGQKFATKETNYMADNRTLYALGQCTPDLSSRDCSDEWADSWSVQYQHNLDDLLQKLKTPIRRSKIQ